MANDDNLTRSPGIAAKSVNRLRGIGTLMRAKDVLKRLVPPILIDFLRGRPLFPGTEKIWDGIYPHVTAVPISRPAYDNEARVAEFVDRTRSALAAVRKGKLLGLEWHSTLSLLAASILHNRTEIRVLDFGGGVGLAFVELLGSLRTNAAIKYCVVDLEKMCVAGRELFADDSRIQFHVDIPPLQNKVDIVYASSVLPYTEDYAVVLRNLAALNAPYLLLTQLAAGEFRTYAAKQVNLAGQTLPYWFLNIKEVLGIVAAAGYILAYESQAGPEYDQSNYPEEYRVGRMRNLLFVRKDETAH